MSADPDKHSAPSAADRELEREIRAGREFSLAEAIARLAGPGGLKGGSPVDRRQQAQAAVDHLLRQHLGDPTGVLRRVLIREVGDSRILLDHLDQPLAALIGHLRQTLASAGLLAELVRMTDMEWGRVMGERPMFEFDGAPACPQDPYTIASVRTQLERLLAALATVEA